MSGKVKHRTPLGFRPHFVNGRMAYDPDPVVRATHARFFAQVKELPLHFGDPLIAVRRHLEFEPHHRYFIKTDLSSAFDQVTAQNLVPALRYRGIKPGWLIPATFFFHEGGRGGLIQGAPASPYLFETYCRYGGLDRDLYEYCDKLGFYYTRYVDDILISAPRYFGRRVLPSVRRIVGRYGFELSGHKTKLIDSQSEPVAVLGYVIEGTRINPRPETLQMLYDEDLDAKAQTGLFRWRRHVRDVGRRRRVIHM